MHKYLIINGSQPALAVAEWLAVVPVSKLEYRQEDYFIVSTDDVLDCAAIMNRLGGALKIVRMIESGSAIDQLVDFLIAQRPTGKISFGISWHIKRQDKLGMEIKKKLVALGRSVRVVTSKLDKLSPVIVKKEKALDLVVTKDGWGLTEAVHDFEGYSYRDFSRPASDAHAGMVPVKLARMMINLAQLPFDGVLLDPFCGSGTILAEALVMGYRNLRGCDLSDKAIDATERNLDWIGDKYDCDLTEVKIQQGDVKILNTKIDHADAIVTEPHLGPPLRGHESPAVIKKIVAELTSLYQQAFVQFAKILPTGGRIVMIMPEWHVGDHQYQLVSQISHPELKRIDNGKLIYHHEKQMVWRQITIWEKR